MRVSLVSPNSGPGWTEHGRSVHGGCGTEDVLVDRNLPTTTLYDVTRSLHVVEKGSVGTTSMYSPDQGDPYPLSLKGKGL